MKRVIVGLSGGVDSSVTALLLKEAGFEVVGLFMKNWEEGDACPAQEDYQDVVRVCSQIGISHYQVNFSKEYWDEVFKKCLEGYQRGMTPNPDILCNREIKFKLFFNKALELGADFIATGHYATVQEGNLLGRGIDEEKDQSYFLYTLKSSILKKVLFPLGNMRKREVRTYALEKGLATAKKKDSTGICFIGKRDFKEFLAKYIPEKKGPIMTPAGKVVGEHLGIFYYTIGQRKGLGIGGQKDEEEKPWFVVGKDLEKNALIVVQGEDHPDLYSSTLIATDVSWVGEDPLFPLRCSAKIRYRAQDALCSVVKEGNRLFVQFDTPQKGIAPGQSIVFYNGLLCLGGAFIC